MSRRTAGAARLAWAGRWRRQSDREPAVVADEVESIAVKFIGARFSDGIYDAAQGSAKLSVAKAFSSEARYRFWSSKRSLSE